MPFPRFRSAERDRRSDIQRLETVHAAVLLAIRNAENERGGLLRRLEETRSRAAFLYGDALDGDMNEDKRSATLVTDAESFLVRGEKRNEELELHFLFLRDLERQISGSIAELDANLSKPDR